jgi:hypothetical protein
MLRKTVNELVARARERLMRLSGERYALVVRDDDFYVIDNDNAGEERPAVTLTRARRAGEQLVAEEAWGADDDLEEVREDGAQRRAP